MCRSDKQLLCPQAHSPQDKKKISKMNMRTAIIGNSGAGKSTLARTLTSEKNTPLLDLDTIVWEPNQIAMPRDPAEVLLDLERFCNSNSSWVVEGCYANCIQAILQYEPELIFLDPGRDTCLSNCRNRPWEPHKYASKAEQDTKLEFLLQWVADYYERDGDMSYDAHRTLFETYPGPKRHVQSFSAQQSVLGDAPKP